MTSTNVNTGSSQTIHDSCCDKCAMQAAQIDAFPNPPNNDALIRQQHAKNQGQMDRLLRQQPSVPQRPLTRGAVPYRRFRGVTWMDPSDGDNVFDIYLSILGTPNQQDPWASDLPCKLFREQSTYFEGVLKQQVGSVRPSVAFAMICDKAAVQLKALKKLLRFILRPPLGLSGPVLSTHVFALDGVATKVLLEMVNWAKYLGLMNADDAIGDLKQEIERRTSQLRKKEKKADDDA